MAEFWSQIFDWHDWDGDIDAIQFYDVTFNEDFGPFKKGETVPSVEMNYLNSCLTEYSVEGQPLREVRIKPSILVEEGT